MLRKSLSKSRGIPALGHVAVAKLRHGAAPGGVRFSNEKTTGCNEKIAKKFVFFAINTNLIIECLKLILNFINHKKLNHNLENPL